MAEHKNNLKHLALFLLVFLYSPDFLICQQIIRADIIFNSDYEIFRELPENKMPPRLLSYSQYLLGSTINLCFTKIDELCVDSSFAVDAIYFHSYDKEDNFKDYRRFFYYDKFYRIESVIAEIYKDSSWLTHQITNVSYNSLNKVKQINHIRYQHEYDDTLIIRNEYNKDNLIISEIRENLDSSNVSWNKVWIKHYNYEDGNLSSYYIEKVKEFYLENDRVEFKYNKLGLPIEGIQYMLYNNLLVNDYKYVWNYNEQNLLSEKRLFREDSTNWKSTSNEYYKYDSGGNLVEESNEDFFDHDTLRSTKIYYSSLFLDSIKYTSWLDKNGLDSLVGSGSTTFEYDSCGYLMGYKILTLYKTNKDGRGIKIKRDEYHNIIFIQDERWYNYTWFPENNTRIIYKRKKS